MYLITLQRVRAGVLQSPRELHADLSKCVPKVREDLRPYQLEDAYYRFLVARAVGDARKKWLRRAVTAARYGAARLKNGIQQYIDLAEVLAEHGHHAAAEQVLCEAVAACGVQQAEETRNEQLAAIAFAAGRLWGKGGGNSFLYLAVEAAMQLPEPQPLPKSSPGKFTTYGADGPPYTRPEVLSTLGHAIVQRFRGLEEGTFACPAGVGARPIAEFPAGDAPRQMPGLDPLHEIAEAIGSAALRADDWESHAMLVGFQAIQLLGAGEVNEPLRLLESLPGDAGSPELDGVRAGGAMGMAKAATREKRLDLLLAAAKLAQPIRDAHFGTIAYRHLARCAFQLGFVEQGESFVKRALQAIDAFSIGSHLQAFHMSRLGISLLAMGDHDRGMALLERAASMAAGSGYRYVVSDLASLIETRNDPSLLDAAYRFAFTSRAPVVQAEAEAYVATLEARVGDREQAVQRLVASARRLEGMEHTSKIVAVAAYAETLVEIGAQQAADELFSTLLSGRIRDQDTESIFFRPPVDCVALTYAHRAAATLDKQLLYKAIGLVKKGGFDPATSPNAQNDRHNLTGYVVYVARRTADPKLVREALLLAARLEEERKDWVAATIAYAAGRMLDTKLIEEVASWARAQRSSEVECYTYLGLAAGMLSGLGKPNLRGLHELSIGALYEDHYYHLNDKLKWVWYPDRLWKQVFLFEDEPIPERLPFDLRGPIH